MGRARGCRHGDVARIERRAGLSQGKVDLLSGLYLVELEVGAAAVDARVGVIVSGACGGGLSSNCAPNPIPSADPSADHDALRRGQPNSDDGPAVFAIALTHANALPRSPPEETLAPLDPPPAPPPYWSKCRKVSMILFTVLERMIEIG